VCVSVSVSLTEVLANGKVPGGIQAPLQAA